MRSRLLTSHLTEIEPDILALCSRPQDYDENDKFKMMMNRIYGMLKAVFRTEDNVYILPASFDTLDEIMLLNFLPSDGYAATLKTANYETDILQAAEQLGCTKNVVEIDFRDGKLSSIEKALQKNEDIDILFLPYCEDTVDLNGIAKICHDYAVLVAVDATLAIGATTFGKDDFHADIVYAAGSSGLALPYGLSFISLNEKAILFTERSVNTVRPKLVDLRIHKQAVHDNKPAVRISTTTLQMLDKRLARIQAAKIESMTASYQTLTERLRTLLQNRGFKVYGDNILNCVSYVEIPATSERTVEELVKYLDEEQSWQVEQVFMLGKPMLKICNFGHIQEHVIDMFVEALEKALKVEKKDDEK